MDDNKEEVIIVGDVRYTEEAKVIYQSGSDKSATNFLIDLQNLMKEYGVVKLDVCFDALKMIKK